jgi:hypothetical protein
VIPDVSAHVKGCGLRKVDILRFHPVEERFEFMKFENSIFVDVRADRIKGKHRNLLSASGQVSESKGVHPPLCQGSND